MKREWSTPSCTIECFEANEYVAVCWGVACIGGGGNGDNVSGYPEAVEGVSHWNNNAEYGTNCHNHNGSCTNMLNNRIIDGNTMQENNSEQGWINGYFDSYTDNNGSGSLDAGDTVYWHTFSGNQDRRWNHCGTVVDVKEGHPNHS